MSELEFRDVSVRFGAGRHAITAVDGVTLRVESGTVLGLVGESGSGKSTIARAGVGLEPCAEGGVFVGGMPVTSGRWGRRRCGSSVQLMFQDPYSSLDPRMTIGSSITEAIPRELELSREAKAAEVLRMLSLVHLESDHARAYPRDLSGGQLQRVAIARVLAARPAVVIADEITSALDASVQGSILNLMRELQRELNLTMLYISHNFAVIQYVCDVIAVMYLGRIVEVASANDLLTDPQHPYTRTLLESIPRMHSSHRPSLALGGDDHVMAALAHDPPDPHLPPVGCRFHTRCPVGPLQDPSRVVCVEVDPNDGAEGRVHQSACHFAATADGSCEHVRPIDRAVVVSLRRPSERRSADERSRGN